MNKHTANANGTQQTALEDARLELIHARRARALEGSTFHCLECGAEHDAAYVAWNGWVCFSDCGGQVVRRQKRGAA